MKGSKLWTGDKKLISGLHKKKFTQIISIAELNAFLDRKEEIKTSANNVYIKLLLHYRFFIY
ncbi:hypothetical protein AHMF7605_09220 [Adhaeribacter arboris]|uniref:Uncharacterized protein n=1 Tax=Adhaeribacter arboris TaxID=2072846 RepID=A0A2T2YDX6_9BACT|nr:hypothetical protein AHMF7605_09220 [Adhaeribacter arboris]